MPLQQPIGSGPLPRPVKEIYAEALKRLERELRDAREAVERDDSEANQTRYCKALFEFDRLQATFPFLAAGFTDDAEA
jgi:hypothetical protein